MGIDGYNRAATPLKTIYSRVIVSEPEEDALFLHFGKTDCMIVVYVNNLLVSMVEKGERPVLEDLRMAEYNSLQKD